MKATESSVSTFKVKLHEYKQRIDEDMVLYARHTQQTTLQQYGHNARMEIDAFLGVLLRGGKRIRGSLVMLGYEMSGGKNMDMIVQAARAIEMLHTYILIIDDIQDNSEVRRGGPAAHILLAQEHHRRGLSGESSHFGISIALNAALSGAHAAQMTLANLDADVEDIRKVLSIVNRTMLVTSYGQTNDIVNEVSAEVSMQDIEDVLEWKTAHYTFLNPLHVGMVLTGANCSATDAITDYAVHAGKAYQITDDILGMFGNEHESGKSPLDDVREGKRTLLVIYALEHASNSDNNFMIQMLGNQELSQIQFSRFKDIVISTGALIYAKKQARHHIHQANASLQKHADKWTPEGVSFLKGLAQYLLDRKS